MENNNNSKNEPAGKAALTKRGIMMVVLGLLVVCVAVVIFLKYPTKKPAAPKPSLVHAGSPNVAPTPAAQSPKASFPDAAESSASAAQPAADIASANAKGKNAVDPKKDAKPKADKVVQDPLSRVALSLVGLDSDAEEYWVAAVFDPDLPKSEQQDLIDDLNEEGLPDPKHPTEDDLPVLSSRLEMLEALIPFVDGSLEWEEAREDLLNLIANARGGGYPVD